MRVPFAAILAAVFFFLRLLQPARADSPSAVVIGDTTRAGNIIEIAPADTPEKSGELLLKTIESLDRPSRDRPFVLRLSPGIFFLGKKPLMLRPFVAIEGCGALTLIRGSVAGEGKGLVIGADNASVRSLRIENRAEGPLAVGILNKDASPVLSDLEVLSAGSGECTYGIWNSSSIAMISGARVRAEGAVYNHGIFNQGASPVIRRSDIRASGGEEAFGILNLNAEAILEDVTAEAQGASSFNVGLWNIKSPCEIKDVSASSAGGDQNVGIYNMSCDPLMDRIQAKAYGRPGTGYGVRNLGSSPTIANSVVRMSGSGYGIHNISSSPHLINVLVSAMGEGGHAVGLFNSGQGNRVKADRCTIAGTGQAIYSDGGSSVSLGGCAIEGPVAGEGAFYCAFCYSSNRTALDAFCR